MLPDGVDGLIDAALLEDKAVGAVRDGGSVVTLRGYDGSGLAEPNRRGVVVPPHLRPQLSRREHAKLDELRGHAEAGALTLRVARTFPADQAPEAHRQLEAGGVRGRLVLEF